MLEKIKLGLVTGVFALGMTACGGGAGETLIKEGKEAVEACRSEKDDVKRTECVNKALTDVSAKWTKAATDGDITADDTKAFQELTTLSQEVIEGKKAK